MKKNLLIGISSFLAGVILTAVLVYVMAPGAMLIEDESMYDFDETIEKFEASVAANDWKIPAVHDLQATMTKFGYDVSKVKVYELCHPDHAYRILAANDERIVSSLMPCRVAIYEKNDGKVYVSRMNTALMSSMMGDLIKEVMAEASSQNEEILAAILGE